MNMENDQIKKLTNLIYELEAYDIERIEAFIQSKSEMRIYITVRAKT